MRPITAFFTEKKTDSVTEEIRRKEEEETAGPVRGCDRVWPFADAEGTFSCGSQGRACAEGKHKRTHKQREAVTEGEGAGEKRAHGK
ncbi:hypothetical protein KUCAC02_020186 [Chaenocephalus aceratus]|uniref:Uncharacterized protein n=1 Tax=Chaenocephalus aceratus TaxID=36190 RepID=A0ACB9VQS0_CHAAC|nr:hypothetical protein KUCAC02_020186 [Chaenocephalus aceratus]